MFSPYVGGQTYLATPQGQVAKLVGKSFPIVEAVYYKLDLIEQLNNNDNINFVVEHFDELLPITDTAKELVDVITNLPVILKTPDLAKQAQTSANLAVQQSVAAQYYAQDAERLRDETGAMKDYVQNSGIKEVSKSLDLLNQIKANLNNIVPVGLDISADASVIRKLSNNLNQLSNIATTLPQLEEISKLNDDLLGLDLIMDAKIQIQRNITDLQAIKNNINNTISKFNIKAGQNLSDLNEATLDIVNNFEYRANVINDSIDAQIAHLAELAKKSETFAQSAHYSADLAVEKLLEIREIYNHIDDKAVALVEQVIQEFKSTVTVTSTLYVYVPAKPMDADEMELDDIYYYPAYNETVVIIPLEQYPESNLLPGWYCYPASAEDTAPDTEPQRYFFDDFSNLIERQYDIPLTPSYVDGNIVFSDVNFIEEIA